VEGDQGKSLKAHMTGVQETSQTYATMRRCRGGKKRKIELRIFPHKTTPPINGKSSKGERQRYHGAHKANAEFVGKSQNKKRVLA